MPRAHPLYPDEFRTRIVEFARGGRNPSELAGELEPTETIIRSWWTQADRDDGKSADGLATDGQEKLRELRSNLSIAHIRNESFLQFLSCSWVGPVISLVLFIMLAAFLPVDPAAGQQPKSVSFTEANAGLTGTEDGSTSIANNDGNGGRHLLATGDDAPGNRTTTLYLNQSSVEVQPPTDLQATAGDGQVDLTWSSGGSSPAGYNVYRSTESFSNPSSARKLNGSPISSTSYPNTEVTNGTEYFYRVIAVSSDGEESDLSDEESVVPDLPTDFSDQKVITTHARNAEDVHAADLTGDGNPDVLSASLVDNKVAWYENEGDGSFASQSVITTDVDDVVSVHASDLDGDGAKDVLSASINDNKIAWYKNQENESFSDQKTITTNAGDARSVYAADLTGDGKQDVLSASGDGINDKIAWYENLGDGSFSAQKVISTEAARGKSVHAADLDGDGDQDVLSASANDDKIAWYENLDDEGFSEQRVITTSVDRAWSVRAADLTGDGDQDVLSASDIDNKIAWYENFGDGSFSSQKIIATNANDARSVYTADLDGDGDQDVLSASAGNNKIVWYENVEGAAFSDQNVLTSDADGAESVYAADLTGDGDRDVLSASAVDDKIAWYENLGEEGGGELEPPTELQASAGDSQVGLTWNAGGSSDLDGYNVYRSTESFSDVSEATEVANVVSTNYTDEGVINGTEYFYRVTAVDGDGNESDPSEEVQAKPGGDEGVVYSEDFSDAPNYVTRYSQNTEGEAEIYWDQANGDYYAKVQDQSSEWWSVGKSPVFPVVESSEAFTVSFKFNPVQPDWGHYPAVYFVDSDSGSTPRELAKAQAFNYDISWSDNTYKKFELTNADGDEFSTPTIPAEDEWYDVTIDYDPGSETIDLQILREDGSTFVDETDFSFPISGSFDQLMVGETQGDVKYGNQAQIRVDDIVVNTGSVGEGESPEPPTDLQATAGDGQVDLTWSPGGDSSPAGYNVYRSTSSFTNPSSATKLDGSPVSSTSYSDTEVSNGTEYFYRVTAVDGEGIESQPSGEVAAIPPGIREENVLSAYSEIAKSVADTQFGLGLQEEYENQNIKHLGFIQAGLFDLLEAGVFIDLDDYFGITEEGQNDYVTVWLNAAGSIGVSLLPFDLGIIRTKYTEGIPDPRGGFDLSLSQIRAGSIQVEAFTKMENGEVQPVSWEFNESFELNASASFGNLAWQFYQFEMKRDVLNDIVEASLDAASPPTTIGQFSGDILFNLLFDFPESPLEHPIPEFDPAVDDPSDVRFLTRTDDGDAPEIASTINYGRGGMDTDDDGFRDNEYPVIEERLLRTVLGGWEFNLKFTAESKEGVITDYGVSPIEIPDGWYIKPYKDGEDTLPNIADREWNANDLSPGEAVVTRWQVSPTDPTQSPVQIGFELYEDKTFSDTPLDTLYVEFKQGGSVSAFAAKPTVTGQSNTSATSPGPKTKPSSSGSLVDSTRDTPFRLSLETPSGKMISPTSVDLTESRYMEADFDSSGTIDAQYVIANPEDGNYSVKVEPVSDTLEGTRITVEAVTSGTAQTVAKDQPVPEEGSDTYSVNTDPLGSRPARTAFDVQRNFGDASDPSDYRLVALPGAVDHSLSTAVEGEAGVSWTAFWDSGASEDFLVEHDGSETFSLRPGRGFWLTARESWIIQDSVDTVPLGNDRSASVPLHDGWNIISNPLSADVAWSNVRQVNGSSLQPVWTFDGSFARADTFRSAKAGKAFYFLNDTGLDSLEVPYPGTSDAKTKRRVGGESFLTLDAQPSEAVGPTSTVQIGFDKTSDEGLGRFDQPAPPGRFSAVSLRLEAPGEAPPRRKLLAAERRPPTVGDDGGHTFQLLLQTKTNAPIQIAASGLGATGGAEAKLLRPATGRSYDLREERTINLKEADSTALKLAVGSPAYVDGQEQKVVPDEVTLTSYPNPMRRQATLEYTLPEAKEVRLAVYDVLGRRVAVLEDGRKQAGRHRVRLEGHGLSSGVYFGRLRVGEQTRTQKITVVR